MAGGGDNHVSYITKPTSALGVSTRPGKSNYPEPFASLMEGRSKHKLGDLFGLENFGVNLTTLKPGGISALFHEHSKQDEFVYVLEGTPVLMRGDEEYLMSPGECVGFKAGSGSAHQLINRSNSVVSFLEIGDRSAGDRVSYPNDDIVANLSDDGNWVFTHKDGAPY
jgi:uncharacterized cupin superfamily protein